MPDDIFQRSLSLRQQVYERLRTGLRAGEYKPSQRLTEIGIADALGVSRTPVREALGMLSHDGLLLQLPKGGFCVPEIQVEDLNNIFELRYLLEPYAAGLAARNANHDGVSGIHAAIQSEKRNLTDHKYMDFTKASDTFRHRLFEMADNKRLLTTIFQVEAQIQSNRTEIYDDWNDRTAIIAEQERILEAVCVRNAENAARAMRVHLTTIKNMLMIGVQHQADSSSAVQH